MVDFVFIALLGLFLLIPLEIIFLIILAAVSKREDAPKIVIPEPKPQARYGWEDYLQFSPERKLESPTANNRAIFTVILLVVFAISLIVPTYLFVIPAISINQTVNETIDVVDEINITEVINDTTVPDLGANISLNLSGLVPKLNISGFIDKVIPYKSYIYTVLIAVVVLIIILAIFMYFIRRRKLAVINKAKQIAEKLIKKAEEATPPKIPQKEITQKPAFLKNFFSKIPGVRQYIMPLVVLFLLIIIALLVYLLRDRISTDLADLVLKFLTNVKDFVFNYRIYVVVGITALIIIVAILRYFSKKHGRS